MTMMKAWFEEKTYTTTPDCSSVVKGNMNLQRTVKAVSAATKLSADKADSKLIEAMANRNSALEELKTQTVRLDQDIKRVPGGVRAATQQCVQKLEFLREICSYEPLHLDDLKAEDEEMGDWQTSQLHYLAAQTSYDEWKETLKPIPRTGLTAASESLSTALGQVMDVLSGKQSSLHVEDFSDASACLEAELKLYQTHQQKAEEQARKGFPQTQLVVALASFRACLHAQLRGLKAAPSLLKTASKTLDALKTDVKTFCSEAKAAYKKASTKRLENKRNDLVSRLEFAQVSLFFPSFAVFFHYVSGIVAAVFNFACI